MYSLSISFFIRRSRTNKHGKSPVYCRIRMNGRFADFSTRRWVHPDNWLPDSSRVKGNSLDVKELNHHLTMVANKLYSLHTQLINSGATITPEQLRDEFLGKNQKQISVCELFGDFIKQMQKRVGYDLKAGTVERYQVTIKHVIQFIKEHYQRQDLALGELKYPFIREFKTYLRVEQGISHNVTVKYIRNLRKVVKWAVENEWLVKDPFYGFTLQYEEVDTTYLTEDELQHIENIVLSNSSLAETRDVFLFACYTGLAYSDLKRLTPEDIETDREGYQWINIRRRKNSTLCSIFLLPEAVAIMTKYKDHPACELSGKLLPLKSNPAYNKYLKKLAAKSGIHKNLTSHVARHTCATLLVNKGVPIETVSKILGKKSIKQTQHYAKLLNKKVKEDMLNITNKYDY